MKDWELVAVLVAKVCDVILSMFGKEKSRKRQR